MLLHPSLLLALLCLCGPDSFIISPKGGVNEWITSQVLGYIGRFHEYPTNGTDLIEYTKTSFDIYKNEYGDMINYITPGPSIEIQKRAFLNRFNAYNDNSCTIYYKKNKFNFSLSLTEWQLDHYSWIAYYYKPALYDKDGHYLFYLTDQIQDHFNESLLIFSKSFPHHYRYNTSFPADIPQTVTPPLKVRVRYERGGSISLIENYVIPKSTFISRNGIIVGEVNTIERTNIIQMIDNYLLFFNDFLQLYPEIWVVDCLIPLCF
jgi:hypothetical protein